jgi:membrane-associated phospholipid phosphatase
MRKPVPQPARPSPEQLISPRLRTATGLGIGVCALAVILLGVLVTGRRGPTGLDSAVWRVLPYPWGPAGQQGAGRLFLAAVGHISDLGAPLAITVLTAALCCCCLALRRYRAAIMVVGAEISASVLTRGMKPVFDRTIGGSTSYPSGHTTAAFALGAAFVLVLASSRTSWIPARLRIALSVLTLATAALVGLGMVAWREHYLTDTFGGAAVGIGAALAVALFVDLVAERRHRREPARRPAPDAGPVTAVTAKS